MKVHFTPAAYQSFKVGPTARIKTKGTRQNRFTRLNILTLAGIMIIAAAALAVPFHSVHSSSVPKAGSDGNSNSTILSRWSPTVHVPAPLPLVSDPLETFAADCATPKTTFVLGDTVCAKATGLVGYRFAWVDSAGFIRDRVAITTDPQTDSFTLPLDPTTVVNGTTVDNRGEWRVNAITSRSSLKSSAFFTVTDPANKAVDLSITKTMRGDTAIENGTVLFAVSIVNNGPDDAVDAHFVDSAFSGATFNSITQTDGPAFTCTGSGSADCTLALFPKGAVARFTLNFTAGTAGANLQNTATVSSATTELNAMDNSYTTASVKVASGVAPPSCTLDCPDNINANANTEENSVRGAHVSFAAPASSGTCGTITTSPASGSFFPVGTTTVTSTSSVGDGSCSFTITVVDQGNPPTISCPVNKTGTANNDCAAVVSVGTATATGGANVTVIGTRSDGRPMYNCDANGTNCTRRSSDDPFASGVTTITWIAYSHDVAGPYADADTEELHRTGSDTCTQTVTVDDVTPPVITAQDQTVSADASCQTVVPDYTNDVSDNCSCAANDNSEDCVGQHVITLTQDVPAGTMLGLGAHTIHLTANDGSSNNGGAGNETTKTITLTVVDTTAPTVTAPADSSASADANCQAAVPNYVAGSTASDNCDSSVTLTQSPAAGTMVGPGPHTVTVTGTDDASNQGSDTVVFTVVDTTPPVISCPANIVVYLPLNSTATSMVVNYTAPVGTDNCGATTAQTGGLASGATFPVGTTINTFRATDAAGNHTDCSFTVTVLYNFTGFFSPVSNPPTLNTVNAGKAIPVKFSLSGYKGLNIFAPDNPYSVSFNCATNDPGVDIVETVNAGGSSLSFGGDQYNYVWKTENSWANTCRQLVVTLNDGSVHTANFKFR